MDIKNAVKLVIEKLGEGRQVRSEFVADTCPFCNETKKKFYFNVENLMFSCKRGSCAETGGVNKLMKQLGIEGRVAQNNSKPAVKKKVVKKIKVVPSDYIDITQENFGLREYMESRGITEQTLVNAQVKVHKRGEAFAFFTGNASSGEVFSINYRSANKKIWMETGSKPYLWNRHNVDDKLSRLYITEGRIDALTLLEMGIHNVVSVPNGTSSLEWIENEWDLLNKFNEIVLCYDNDDAGDSALIEVKKRLDFADLYKVDLEEFGDINDYYMKGNFAKFKKLVDEPKQVLMDGVVSLEEVSASGNLTEKLTSCGIPKLDNIYGGIRYGELSLVVGGAGCLPSTTEVMTQRGWIKISEFDMDKDLVMGVNDDHSLSLDRPIEFHKKPADGFKRIKSRTMQITTSNYHTIYSKSAKGVAREYNTLEEFTRKNGKGTIPYTYNYEVEGLGMTDDEIRFQIMINADGYNPKPNKIYVNVKKDRKKERFEMLAEKLGVEYSVQKSGEGYKRYYFKGFNKGCFDTSWYKANKRQREIILEEIRHWDGSFGVGNRLGSYSSCIKEDADYIQFIAHSLGYRAPIYKDVREDRNICYEVNFSKQKSNGYCFDKSREVETLEEMFDGMMYCFKMPSNKFLARENGKIYISHNTGKTSFICNLASSLLATAERVMVWSGELNNAMLKSWLYSTIGGEEAVNVHAHPFRPQDTVTTIKPEAEKKIDEYVRNRLFAIEGSANDGFDLIKKMRVYHKRYGVKHFVIDNMSIVGLTKKGISNKYELEEEFVKELADFMRNNEVHIWLLCHPTKQNLNDDPNFMNKDKVKNFTRLGIYDVRGSASLANLASNMLMMMRINKHMKAWFKQHTLNICKNAGLPAQVANEKVDMIESDASLLMYLVKNRSGGCTMEDSVWGYDKNSRRLYDIFNKEESLSRQNNWNVKHDFEFDIEL